MKMLHKFLPVVILLSLVSTNGVAGDLRPYKGKSQPPPLTLPDLNAVPRSLESFKGKVVLLNFWATWCPPCRIEMPSMWRLKNKLKKNPFEVVAIDMGEEREIIQAFMPDEMERDFIVLQDIEGNALRDWKIFAFPTSFLIDKKGRIRYALYGALEWDAPDVVEIVEKLVNE